MKPGETGVVDTALADAAKAAAAAVPVEPPPAAEVVETEVVETAAKGPAPWDAWVAEDFEESEREKVDAFLRKRYQPYVTKINEEKADAVAKSWVFDRLNEDPTEALREIAAQVYDDDTAERIVELLKAGATVEEATEVAETEAAGGKLDPDVQELVDWAKDSKAREAAQAKADEEAKEIADATEALTKWRDDLVAAEPDIVVADLTAYVATLGNFEAAYAAYRAAHPKPEPVVEEPPPTLGGRSGAGSSPARPASSLAEAAGRVFDAASSGT